MSAIGMAPGPGVASCRDRRGAGRTFRAPVPERPDPATDADEHDTDDHQLTLWMASVQWSASARENILRIFFRGVTAAGLELPRPLRQDAEGSPPSCSPESIARCPSPPPRSASWRSTPTRMMSSSSAPARSPCSARAGCHGDDRHDDPRRLRLGRARRRGDRRDPQGGGEGVGRPARGRLPVPGVPRPGDLQRRPVAAAGRRVPPPGPARPDPDGAAGRLPRRSRGDERPGPRRLLRRLGARTTRPASGSRPRRWTASRTSTSSTRSEGTDRDGNPVPPDFRIDVSEVWDLEAADARLPRQPAGLAAAAARDRRVPGDPAALVVRTGAGRSAWRMPRGSASTRDIRTRGTTGSRRCSGRMARRAQLRRAGLRRGIQGVT